MKFEFDKAKVYTVVNADELKLGSKCIFTNTLARLKKYAEIYYDPRICDDDKKMYVEELKYIKNDNEMYIFNGSYTLAYLIEEP